MTARRYAVLDCEDAPRWAGHDQNWIDLLQRSGEVWQSYRVWAGELPAGPDAYDGYLITGSHHSVNDADQGWLGPLFEFVRAAAAAEARVFGACFGLQVIATAFGGRVESNPDGRFVFGSERIRFAGLPDVGEALTLLESHGEQATGLPPGARRLASSASAENEMFAIGDHVLAVQFHAEFTPAMMLAKILPRLREDGRLDADQEARALASLEAGLDSAHFIAAIRRFLG